MSWRPLTAVGDEAGFTPAEQRALQAVQNSATGLATKATTAIRMFVGGMRAIGYPVNSDDTVPDQLRPHVLAWAVWDFVTSFPSLKSMATPERKAKRDDAQRIYERILTRAYGAIEPPTGTDITTGNWNSEAKLIMRTHPVPPPALQFQQTQLTQPLYANPNAANDQVPTNSPGVPQVPSGLTALPGAAPGTIELAWDPAPNATGYNVYRGTASGQELATPIAANIPGTNFQDAGLTTGTSYFYKVQAVNGAMVSVMSLEAVAVPN